MSPIFTKMVFIEDARDASKASNAGSTVLIGLSKPIEVVGLKVAHTSDGQCELLSWRVTKEGKDAAD